MNKFYLIAFILISISIILFILIDPKEEVNPNDLRTDLIEEELQERIDKYIARRYKNCKDKYLEEAILHVDSIISHELLIDAVDTMAFPNRPFRPPYDAKDSLRIDSILIEPLFIKIDSISNLPI